jgi:hypothetical protein
LLWLATLLWSGEHVTEAIEAPLPEGTPAGDPAFQNRETGRLHAAGAHATLLMGTDEAAPFEHLEMLDHGGESNVQRTGQF